MDYTEMFFQFQYSLLLSLHRLQETHYALLCRGVKKSQRNERGADRQRETPTPQQDCEIKAFSRLAATLKSRFARLPIILLGDLIYACQPVFDLCRKYRWHFIFTFKEGALPALSAEFVTLSDYAPTIA